MTQKLREVPGIFELVFPMAEHTGIADDAVSLWPQMRTVMRAFTFDSTLGVGRGPVTYAARKHLFWAVMGAWAALRQAEARDRRKGLLAAMRKIRASGVVRKACRKHWMSQVKIEDVRAMLKSFDEYVGRSES